MVNSTDNQSQAGWNRQSAHGGSNDAITDLLTEVRNAIVEQTDLTIGELIDEVKKSTSEVKANSSEKTAMESLVEIKKFSDKMDKLINTMSGGGGSGGSGSGGGKGGGGSGSGGGG